MILPSDTALKAGVTYTVTVQFGSDRSDVHLRLLVSDLAAAVLTRINADPITARRVAWMSTAVRDDAVGPNVHEAAMAVRVVHEAPTLRVAVLERLFREGFAAGSGNPLYPGVAVWRVAVVQGAGKVGVLTLAVGAAAVLGGIYVLTQAKRRGMARAIPMKPSGIHRLTLNQWRKLFSGTRRVTQFSRGSDKATILDDGPDVLAARAYHGRAWASRHMVIEGAVEVTFPHNDYHWLVSPYEGGDGMAKKVRRKKVPQSAAETKLERIALRWLNAEGENYDDGAQGAFRDLVRGGCQSGIVGGLIYYKDTIPFFKRYKDDIAALLREAMRDHGTRDPKDLFGNKWDEEDPFVEEDTNRNLLAWFGFEEAARRVADRAGLDE